jgi:hypothetical protein
MVRRDTQGSYSPVEDIMWRNVGKDIDQRYVFGGRRVVVIRTSIAVPPRAGVRRIVTARAVRVVVVLITMRAVCILVVLARSVVFVLRIFTKGVVTKKLGGQQNWREGSRKPVRRPRVLLQGRERLSVYVCMHVCVHVYVREVFSCLLEM